MDINPYEAPAVAQDEVTASDAAASPRHRSFRLTPRSEKEIGTLREAFWFAVVQQAVLISLSSMMLDMGECSRVVCIAGLAFWSFVAVFWIRRRNCPTKCDIVMVKYGIWLTMGLVAVLGSILGQV